jgi:hypothetical protein
MTATTILPVVFFPSRYTQIDGKQYQAVSEKMHSRPDQKQEV